MSSFAQRMGYKPIRTAIQTDSLDEGTRIAIWNALHVLREVLVELDQTSSRRNFGSDIALATWIRYFEKPRDEMPRTDVLWNDVKFVILEEEWVEVLDITESIVGWLSLQRERELDGVQSAITEALNKLFQDYLVGFRFINGEITPIESSLHADTISGALDAARGLNGARYHLEQAVERLADRQNPDYPNVVKEAISAVESVCATITGEQNVTLGQALKKLESKGVVIHGSLREAWSKLYGWTSDGDGIRHGKIEAPDADQALAKYMLVSSSAFVTHLIETARKARLLEVVQE